MSFTPHFRRSQTSPMPAPGSRFRSEAFNASSISGSGSSCGSGSVAAGTVSVSTAPAALTSTAASVGGEGAVGVVAAGSGAGSGCGGSAARTSGSGFAWGTAIHGLRRSRPVHPGNRRRRGVRRFLYRRWRGVFRRRFLCRSRRRHGCGRILRPDGARRRSTYSSGHWTGRFGLCLRLPACPAAKFAEAGLVFGRRPPGHPRLAEFPETGLRIAPNFQRPVFVCVAFRHRRSLLKTGWREPV